MRHDGINSAKPIDLSRCEAKSDRQREFVSHRSQALLAAAGMDQPARRWFVIEVKKGKDRKVVEAMAREGIEAWAPFVLVKPTRRGGMPRVARQLREHLVMAGLVFVKMPHTRKAWAWIGAEQFVTGALGGATGIPFAIPDEDVHNFRIYLANDPEAPKIAKGLAKAGDQVLVLNGPFRGFPATVSTVDDMRGRAQVEIMIFGQRSPMHVDLAQIAKM